MPPPHKHTLPLQDFGRIQKNLFCEKHILKNVPYCLLAQVGFAFNSEVGGKCLFILFETKFPSVAQLPLGGASSCLRPGTVCIWNNA